MVRRRTREHGGQVARWRDLQFLAAVARAGSVGAAAKTLRVNHSTILRRIANLEATLGTRLFDRLPAGYAFTAAGNDLGTALDAIADRIDAAHRQLLGRSHEVSGIVKVTSSDVVVEGLLADALAAVRERYPAVRVELATSYEFASLERDGDIAVRGADDAPAGASAWCVGAIETVCCAAQSYLDSKGPGLALSEHRWVRLAPASIATAADVWFERHAPGARVVASADQVVAVADAVAAGCGVGLLPRPLLAERPQLVPLALVEPPLLKKIWVLAHPDTYRLARVRAVVDLLRERLGTDSRLRH